MTFTFDDLKRYMEFNHNPELAEIDICEVLALNPKLCEVQDPKTGKNLGMIAATLGLEKVTIFCLQNKTAATQQDNFGRNIGMYSAVHKLEKAVDLAQDNNDAIIQQDLWGYNMGMLCVVSRITNCAEKSLKHPIASKQYNNRGRRIADIIKLDARDENPVF